jgi:tRNA pseudouridine55 synthase
MNSQKHLPVPNPIFSTSAIEGILLINKPKGKTSFSLVAVLRRILNVKTIGHAGTLDPMATGVMVLLIGKRFTTLSDKLLTSDKEYIGEITLGITTDTYDAEGIVTGRSDVLPTLEQLELELKKFQGSIQQTPPMFSAKKVNGQKLYDLARKGQEIEREKVSVQVETTLLNFEYPKIQLKIACSKGTYVRSIAHDLGAALGCGAFKRSHPFSQRKLSPRRVH